MAEFGSTISAGKVKTVKRAKANGINLMTLTNRLQMLIFPFLSPYQAPCVHLVVSEQVMSCQKDRGQSWKTPTGITDVSDFSAVDCPARAPYPHARHDSFVIGFDGSALNLKTYGFLNFARVLLRPQQSHMATVRGASSGAPGA